jgi:hypothetical protein
MFWVDCFWEFILWLELSNPNPIRSSPILPVRFIVLDFFLQLGEDWVTISNSSSKSSLLVLSSLRFGYWSKHLGAIKVSRSVSTGSEFRRPDSWNRDILNHVHVAVVTRETTLGHFCMLLIIYATNNIRSISRNNYVWQGTQGSCTSW